MWHGLTASDHDDPPSPVELLDWALADVGLDGEATADAGDSRESVQSGFARLRACRRA